METASGGEGVFVYLGDFTHQLGLLRLHDPRADKQTAQTIPAVMFAGGRRKADGDERRAEGTASPASAWPKHQIMLH